MMLQTILFGSFVPPENVTTRKCYLVGIGHGKRYTAPTVHKQPSPKRDQLIAVLKAHPEGISASKVAELTGRRRVAIHVALMNIKDIKFIDRKASGKQRAHRLFFLKGE